MTELLIFAGINFIFLIVGYLMGKDVLQQKIKEIIKVRNKTSTGGVATPLNPQDLDKKRSREIMDKFQ